MRDTKKILESKTVHPKKIYKFYFNNFLVKRTVFVLIEKNDIGNNKKLWFQAKQCKIRKNVKK